jgi:phospholipase/carboxylesterase
MGLTGSSSGLLAASGGWVGDLIGPPGGLTEPGDLLGTPLLIATKEHDPWVPPERTIESAEVLAAAGADVDLRILRSGDPGMEEEEVDAVRLLIQNATGAGLT